MSDLVGNPEDRFSCVAAQMSTPNMSFILAIYIVMGPIVLSKGSEKMKLFQQILFLSS